MTINLSDDNKVYEAIDFDKIENVKNFLSQKRYTKGYWLFIANGVIFTGSIDDCLDIILIDKVKSISIMHFNSHARMQSVMHDLLCEV